MDARLKSVIGYGFVPTVTQMDRYLRLATGGKVARNPRLIDDLLLCRRYAAIVEGWQTAVGQEPAAADPGWITASRHTARAQPPAA